MKKTTLFLFSLFLAIGTMAQIKTDKIYTVVAEGHSRGGQPAWAVNNEKSNFVSTGNTTIGDDTQKYFAFIEFNNATYIYSVFAKKFVKNNATLADVGHAVTVEGLNGGKYLFKFDNDHFINIGGDKQMVIDGWGDQNGEVDGGNTMTLTEVGEFSVEDLYEAIAPLYTPNHTGDKSNTGRKIGSFRVNGDTYSLTDAEQTKKFVDKTSKTFTVEVGSEVEVEMQQSAGSWMNAFVYIDTDNNGFTAGVTNNYVPTGDLVSYSFYNNGASSDENGWNSKGVAISGSNRNTVALPSFTAPATPGTYRMRVKYDWCNINPAGDTGSYFSNDFAGHGAAIIDFTLVVESASVTSRRVSVVAGAGGSVSIAGETGTEVEAVGGVNIVATPDYGYGFVNWKKGEEIVSTAASYVYNGEEEAEFVAEFRRLSIDEQYTKLSQPTFTQSDGNITEIAQIEFNNRNITGFHTALGTTTRLNETIKVKAGETYNLTIGYELRWGDISLDQIDNNGTETKYGRYLCEWEAGANPLNILKRDNATMYEDFNLTSLDDFNVDTSGSAPYIWLPYEITIDEDHNFGDLVVVRLVVASENYVQGRCFDILLEVAQQHTLNVSAAGWASLYLDFPAEIPDFGSEDEEAGVYIVTGVRDGGYLNLVKVTEGVLPANTGVIVKAAQGTYDFIYSEDEPANVDGNLLQGTVTDEFIAGPAYVLGNKNGIGFYQALLNYNGTQNKITNEADIERYGVYFKNNNHKAYLLASALAPTMQSNTGYRFAFGGTTAVEEVEMRNEKGEIYDLTGRKLSEITKPGIYIINGKKVLVK